MTRRAGLRWQYSVISIRISDMIKVEGLTKRYARTATGEFGVIRGWHSPSAANGDWRSRRSSLPALGKLQLLVRKVRLADLAPIRLDSTRETPARPAMFNVGRLDGRDERIVLRVGVASGFRL
jgi:hypothetical protein